MVKYTVIIPAYNAEKTLGRCLDSLLCQGRPDVRIALIDDGSTDGTGEIARAYCEQYPLLEYHRQENGGVSSARNRGLSLARSEFISFVDSDDYVMPGYFEVLDAIGCADLLVFDRCHIGGSLRDDSEVFRRLGQMTDTAEKLALLMHSKKIMQPVNKCFRLDLIRKFEICFDETLHIGEDFAFCMAYALRCGSIAVSREQAYCIDVSDGASLSRRYRSDLAEQLSRAAGLIHASIDAVRPPCAGALLTQLDRLHSRNMLMSIAEEFKVRPLPRRSRVKAVCALFREEYAPDRLDRQHAILRLLLRLRLYGCLTMLAWIAKGRNYRRTPQEV